MLYGFILWTIILNNHNACTWGIIAARNSKVKNSLVTKVQTLYFKTLQKCHLNFNNVALLNSGYFIFQHSSSKTIFTN